MLIKTTTELADKRFPRAKVIAAERATMPKTLMERALRRELSETTVAEDDVTWSSNEFGLPALARVSSTQVSSGTIYKM